MSEVQAIMTQREADLTMKLEAAWTEVERLQVENAKLRKDCERLRVSYNQCVEIIRDRETEIGRLRQTIIDLQHYGKKREAEVIEECARVAEKQKVGGSKCFEAWENHDKSCEVVAAAIRALKDIDAAAKTTPR